MKHTKKIILVMLFVALLLPAATYAISLNLDYPSLGGFDLNDDQGLDQIVAWLYVFIVTISGLAAFVMIVWGGIQYMTSSGNPTTTGEAKDKIKQALLGLLLILASFLILQVINPELTLLQTSDLPKASAPSSTSSSAQTSSGAPLPGQQVQCAGRNSFEDNSTESLQTMANRICENTGSIPSDAVIHFKLAEVVGRENCTKNDVAAVRSLLQNETSCGQVGSAGATIQGITIDQTTVSAQLCTFNATLRSSGGVAYSSAIVDNDFILTPRQQQQRGQALNLLKENITDVVAHCSNTQNTGKPYCSLQDTNTTPISDFTPAQQNALAVYCIDIVLGVQAQAAPTESTATPEPTATPTQVPPPAPTPTTKPTPSPIPTPPSSTATCSDPDGIDIKSKGVCTDADGPHEDVCGSYFTSASIAEYECANNKCLAIYRNCIIGEVCKDGACVAQ